MHDRSGIGMHHNHCGPLHGERGTAIMILEFETEQNSVKSQWAGCGNESGDSELLSITKVTGGSGIQTFSGG